MWKTAFKKFQLVWSAQADHITSNVLKAVLYKFYLVHSWIPWPIWRLEFKALREKCPNTKFFWSVFFCIQTRKNSVFGHFSSGADYTNNSLNNNKKLLFHEENKTLSLTIFILLILLPLKKGSYIAVKIKWTGSYMIRTSVMKKFFNIICRMILPQGGSSWQ